MKPSFCTLNVVALSLSCLSVCLSTVRIKRTNRCPLLAIPTAIIYAVQESEGAGVFFIPRVTGCAVLLMAFVMASRRLLPTVMQLLVLKDKEKVHKKRKYMLKAHIWYLVCYIKTGLCTSVGAGEYCKVYIALHLCIFEVNRR